MVRDPASRSWSPARLSGACGPAGVLSAAVRKDLAVNLSAVHENIRGRASKRFRNCFRVQASGSVGPMCVFRLRLRRTAQNWWAPSSKPAILRVFYSGADNIGRRRNANSVGDAILLASSPVSTGCRAAFKAPSAKPTSTRVFWSGPGRWHRPWRRFSG